jgi:hypothetical protein
MTTPLTPAPTSVVWRGYTARVLTSLTLLGLGLLPKLLQGLVPQGYLPPFFALQVEQFAPFVWWAVSTVLVAAAILVLPAPPGRVVLAAIVAVAALVLAAWVDEKSIAVRGIDEWYFSIHFLVVGGGIAVAWLIGRLRPARSWLALIVILAIAALGEPIREVSARLAGDLVNTFDPSAVATFGRNLLGIVLPVIIVAWLAWLLDGEKDRKREQREAAQTVGTTPPATRAAAAGDARPRIRSRITAVGWMLWLCALSVVVWIIVDDAGRL